MLPLLFYNVHDDGGCGSGGNAYVFKLKLMTVACPHFLHIHHETANTEQGGASFSFLLATYLSLVPRTDRRHTHTT
jgi:hypothetical protein